MPMTYEQEQTTAHLLKVLYKSYLSACLSGSYEITEQEVEPAISASPDIIAYNTASGICYILQMINHFLEASKLSSSYKLPDEGLNSLLIMLHEDEDKWSENSMLVIDKIQQEHLIKPIRKWLEDINKLGLGSSIMSAVGEMDSGIRHSFR